MTKMNDKELFQAVFDNLSAKYHRLSMNGTMVYYDNECIMNIDGFSLAYNLYRLTKALNKYGEFE